MVSESQFVTSEMNNDDVIFYYYSFQEQTTISILDFYFLIVVSCGMYPDPFYGKLWAIVKTLQHHWLHLRYVTTWYISWSSGKKRHGTSKLWMCLVEPQSCKSLSLQNKPGNLFLSEKKSEHVGRVYISWKCLDLCLIWSLSFYPKWPHHSIFILEEFSFSICFKTRRNKFGHGI